MRRFVYAAKHFCFLHNRISRTRATGRTPYESRYGHAWPTNKPLLPFGIEVVYRNLRIDMQMSKFGPRGVRGILFGMQETPWAIEVMPERWILERAGPRIEKTQDYSVMSGSFPYRKWEEQRKEKRRLARVTKIERKEEKRSRRAEALMSRAMSVNYVGAVLDERPSETKCSVAKVVHPRSAMKEDGARDALRKELAAIERFEVWGPAVPVEKARLATDAIFVRSHCIFTKKNVHLGPEHHQWKCRLVAGGDRLYDGMGKLTSSHVPYEPPAVLQSVRTALALHAAKGDSIVFVDVTSAYLQAPILGPPVFVWPPTELGMPHGHVVPLKKALYGLPRSGSDFAAYARERLSKRGWVPTLQDKSTYIRDLGGGRASLVLYVDDGMVAGPAGRTMEVVEELRADFVIEKEPQILSDGATVPYLGMKVTRESSTITVDGTDYVENMVTQYREYVGARKSNRPVDYPANAKYEEEGECRHVRELIGMLMWVARTTRPEIMFAVGYLARFADAWNSATDAILSQLLSFLRARPTSQITFLKIIDEKAGERAVEIQVHVFCDADFAGCPHSRKSTTGFVVYVKCGAVWNLVEWSSRKQKVVATSTGQAELISLNEATFQGLLPAMNLVQELCGADVRGFMHCDSEVAISWVRRGFSAKVAHLRKSQGVAIAALHEVYQVQPYGKCELCFVKGTQNPADVLTKPLGPNRMEEAVRLLHEPMASSDWTHCTNAREEQECEVRTRVGTVA